MKGSQYEYLSDFRSINRSPYRNMPSACDYCGYKNRPSSEGTSCTECCHKITNNEKPKKM